MFYLCCLVKLINNVSRIHAVAVCDNAQYFYDHVDQTLEAVGMGDKVKSTEILGVVDGYKGKGYGLTTEKDLGT